MSKRDVYIEKLKARLDKWNADIAALEARSQEAKAEAREKIEDEVATLRRKRDDIKGKIEDLRHASDDAWEDMKDGVELAWNSMGEAVKSAISRFS